MKKLSVTLILMIALASIFFAQTTEPEKKDPYKPTPEKEMQTGIISVTGLLGPAKLSDDNYSTSNPSMKIIIYWNINPHFSVGFGGGVHKYEGPSIFLIEDEGYYLDPTFLSAIENDYTFGPAQFEETWYSIQFNFKLIDGSFSPYIQGGFKYISVDYEQEMFFRYLGSATLQDSVWTVTLNSIAVYGGGGISVALMDYLEALFEVEYTEILDSDIVPGKILFSVGFRFTI
jgi:hypothetical protein